MRILKIEKLFEDESKLNGVLEECQNDFEKVDYYANIMKQNITNNPEEAKKALVELTGTFSNLRTLLAIAETEKKNREIRAYGKLRIDTENEGKKFQDGQGKQLASGKVASYRRVRNLILGYKEACEKSIGSLQSLLKHMTAEMQQTN